MTESNKLSNLKRTPLYDLVVAQNARMTAFSGWEMPLQFTGVKQEHEAVRNSVGMFDISHMGKFRLQGTDLIKKLQSLVPSALNSLKPSQAQYTVLLNEQAGIIDDFIFYYQGEDEIHQQQGILIVNADTTAKDKTWLLSHLADHSLNLTDFSAKKVLIALQGREAESCLQPFVEFGLTDLASFHHTETNILGVRSFIARTGYTGEDGFEIMMDIEVGKKLWRSLLDRGVTPCGLGARDTLRLEAGMSLYGQDIDETTTPLEAGLGWLVHFEDTGEFYGRNILERQKTEGVTQKLVALEMKDKAIARHGYPVIYEGEIVGKITSGSFSPTLNKAIALAYVPNYLSKKGQEFMVEIRGKHYTAIVVKKPFYRPNYGART